LSKANGRYENNLDNDSGLMPAYCYAAISMINTWMGNQTEIDSIVSINIKVGNRQPGQGRLLGSWRMSAAFSHSASGLMASKVYIQRNCLPGSCCWGAVQCLLLPLQVRPYA